MDSQLQDQILRFGGGASESTITPAAGALLVASILLLFLLSRKYALVLFLAISIFVPYSQVILIGGVHFNVFRVLLPFAWARALLGRSDDGRFRISGMDKAILWWALADAICASLLWQSSGAIVNACGHLYSVFGTYFLLRLLVQDREDVSRVIRTLAVACGVMAVFMAWERFSGRNLFSVLGGVPEFIATRDGRLRAQGAFAHAIVAGTVGATLLPLFLGLWWQGGKSRIVSAVGVLSALVMTVTSASATPLLALIAGVVALCLWPFRRHMRLFRWGLVLSLIGLHLVMKGPVWAIIKHVDVVGGASGYHRYELIDQAIRHFGEWWLLGAKNPADWGFFTGDVSNAYVSVAVDSGLLALLLFLGIFRQSFRALGIARRAATRDRKLELQVWAFGATLFSNVVAFIGIWYFDQSLVIWYALLAMISAITSVTLASAKRVRVPAPEAPAAAWAVTTGA